MTEMTKEEKIALEESQLKAAGLKKNLAAIVSEPTFKSTKDGAKTLIMRLAIYPNKDEADRKVEYKMASHYIKAEKIGGKLEDYLASLHKGDLISIEYKVAKTATGEIVQIFNSFKRERKTK